MILLGKRIKELRTKSKMTQPELAEKVGVTKSTIAAYENDTRSPSYEVLVKMADVFKVSTDSIILGRTESTLDVSGLNPDQIHILENIVSYFRKITLLDNLRNKADLTDHEKIVVKYFEKSVKLKNENKK